MKIKKILAMLLAIILVLGMFAGCSKKKDDNKVENGGVTLHGSTISVSQLKEKYGESDEGKILPLYNLDPNEPLAISLKYTPKDERAVFSIHTDEKCLEKSEVALMWSPSSYMPTGPKTYEVRPIIAPLSNVKTEGLWGNVSTYYIKFNYDINAETETKLDEPVIVPMSIKSPAAIPDTNYVIENGCFKLTWKAVEGATEYKIYQRQVIKLFETTNIAPKGKEEAYVGNFPSLVATVDAKTLEYNDWMKDGKGGLSTINSDDTIGGKIISYQNQGVNGEYYVTAVVDGKESLFSNGVATYGLQLPKEFAKGTSLLANSYESAEDLPKTVNITYVDGSQKSHGVIYETKSGSSSVTYKIEGTAITGYVTVKSGVDKVVSEEKGSSEVGGFVEVENNIPQNAPVNVPTINDGKTATNDLNTMPSFDNDKKDDKEDDKKEPIESKPEDKPVESKPEDKPSDEKPSEEKNDSEKTIVEQQIENTEKVVEEANKKTVVVSDGMVVNASSAAEEYLALQMIAGEKNISLAAFPEIQSWSILTDVLCEVIYQNPMILGVKQYGYDYGNMTLTITYEYTQDEIIKKQKEIMDEGKKVIETIITEDMSDAEKRRAIYNYLEDNTKYDDAALENAEKNNFQKVDSTYKDSFSTYGILVKKIGVCQSYAYTYDYLCELADVECITVTGYMMGYMPHAWNKVQIGDEWFVIDVTNNEKSLGIKDFMYENPDQVAYALGYIEDDLFYTQDEANKYVSSDTKHSKYKDCTLDSMSALENYVKKNAKAGSALEFIATYEDFDSDDVIAALRKTDVSEIGNSMIICGYVWCEIVK